MSALPNGRRTRGEQKRDKFVAFRWTPDEHEQIVARAQARNMTVTDFLVKAALGQLETPALEERMTEFDVRLERLERLADLGGFS